MENNKTPQQSSLFKRQDKDRNLLLNHVRSKVENGTGLSFSELKLKYNEEQLFYVSLKYVTTTKKVLCTAMQIPIEAGCRYKRNFEKKYLLVESVYLVICPYTKHLAKLISTNTSEFERLKISNSLQTSLF